MGQEFGLRPMIVSWFKGRFFMLVGLGGPVDRFVFLADYYGVVAIFDGLAPKSADGILLLVDPVSEGI